METGVTALQGKAATEVTAATATQVKVATGVTVATGLEVAAQEDRAALAQVEMEAMGAGSSSRSIAL